ncbi:hypothetical protein F5B19DRAFT_498617 [Rostrohypoxylon terebratum]|nr:hypothetical protein F5B19DRAFT_498617 [Rostrohypoxylon terebratum]
MSAKIGDVGISAADQKFFTVIFKYLPTGMDLDWDRFAVDMGFKDASIAKVRFRQIRKKYKAGMSGTDASPSSSKASPRKVTKPKTPRKARVKKQGAGLDHGDDDDEKKMVIDGGSEDDEIKRSIKAEHGDEDDSRIKKEAISDHEN